MTREERFWLMDRLARDNAESRANIAERQRQREADPFSEREMLVADARFTKDNSDLVYTDPVASEDDEPELVYKTYDNSEPATAPQSIDADTVSRAIGIVIVELRKEWSAEFKSLEKEIIALRAKVDVLTTLFAGKAKSADIVDLPGRRSDVA